MYMYNTFAKTITAVMLSLVLVVGTFGAMPTPAAHAESGSALEDQSISELRATLIALIRQLLAALQLQFVLAGGSLEDLDEDEDESEDCDDVSDDTGLSELEADIFTNETVVEIEIDGDKEIFVTEADTRSDIIDAILDEYPVLTRDEVDNALELEEEDRASRTSDKDVEEEVEDEDDEDEEDSSCDDEDSDDDDLEEEEDD